MSNIALYCLAAVVGFLAAEVVFLWRALDKMLKLLHSTNDCLDANLTTSKAILRVVNEVRTADSKALTWYETMRKRLQDEKIKAAWEDAGCPQK